MATIRFTDNDEDLSSQRGFQFKFFCNPCGNGSMSTLKTSKIGLAANGAIEIHHREH